MGRHARKPRRLYAEVAGAVSTSVSTGGRGAVHAAHREQHVQRTLSQLLLALVARNIRAPRLRAHSRLGLPDHVELAITFDLADHDGLV